MKISAQVKENSGRISAVVDRPKGDYQKYTGEYEVTPSLSEDITLDTAHKVMTDDVTVRKVPQYEIINDAGGNTLIIGGYNG